MKIALTAESTVDLPQNLLQQFDIQTIPFYVVLGEEYIEDREGVSQQIYDYVAATKQLPKTAAINVADYQEFFSKIKQDYDAIIHVSLSSGISSACSNAIAAAKNFENVFVIDSLQLSTGIAILAVYARKLIDEGREIHEIVELLNKKVPQLQTGFILENLNYLYKGGRCSALALLGANILKIKPQIDMKEGKLGVKRKFIGNMRSVADKYITALLQDYPNPNLDYVFITHSSDMPEIVADFKKKLAERGFVHIYDTFANGTICSHCGQNCIGILFDGGDDSIAAKN